MRNLLVWFIVSHRVKDFSAHLTTAKGNGEMVHNYFV